MVRSTVPRPSRADMHANSSSLNPFMPASLGQEQEPSITANTPRLHAVEVKCRDAPFAKDKVHTVVRAHPFNSTSIDSAPVPMLAPPPTPAPAPASIVPPALVVQPCRLNHGVERVRKALAFDPEMEHMLS